MPGSENRVDGTDAELNSITGKDLSRRQLLRGSVATTGALMLGVGAVGTASASGKGGESAIDKEYHKDEEFTVKRRLTSDDDEPPFDKFVCDKGGNGIRLAGWKITYKDDEETVGYLYTRDNSIDKDATYKFNGNGKVNCGDFYLTPFSKV